MDLKLLSSEVESIGSGQQSGTTARETYKCPCGKSEVIYEKDDIVGRRTTSIICYCNECSDLYTFGRGTAELK